MEAPIYVRLDMPTQGVEQGCSHKGRCHYGQLRLLLMAGERLDDGLGRRHDSEVHERQQDRERAVDEGAVYDEGYVVEAVPQDRYTHGDGDAEEGSDPKQQGNHPQLSPASEWGVLSHPTG